ncbi:MAG: class I SAM-dependent methyltransferase [Armatimonadota bacterium]|nr:class I SAM-dependent methyltransferase [Armatimonadota bacterium]
MVSNSSVDWEDYATERILTRNRLVKAHHRAVTRVLVDWFAAEDTSQSFLEIGCGDGFWLDLLRNLGVQRIKGIDVSLHYVKICQAKGHDVECCSFADYTPSVLYDWVYLIDVLEHLDDPRAALDNILQKVRPGGKILVVTPVYESIVGRAQRAITGVSKLSQAQKQDPTHIQAFSSNEVRTFLESAGCRTVKCTYAASFTRLYGLKLRLLNTIAQNLTFGGRTGDQFLIVARKI